MPPASAANCKGVGTKAGIGDRDGAPYHSNGDRDAVPYQSKVFRDFIALVGRLFYDDSSIVLLDFFAREQKAFTESEMKDRLRWREALLHQKLHGLEKQLLVERIVESEKGAKSIQLWRIHSHVFVAVAWRLRTLEDALQEEVRKASNKNDFLCSNSNCARRVSILDAAAGPRALEDDHPLCRLCGYPLTTADSEEAKKVVESKLKRAYSQLSSLRDALQRVRGMSVPEFTSESALVPTENVDPVLDPSASALKSETAAAASSTSANDSRAIPWFGDNRAVPSISVQSDVPVAQLVPDAGTRMVFGTAAVPAPTLVKPAAFKLPNSFSSASINLKTGVDGKSAQSETVTPSDQLGRSPIKVGSAGSGVGTKPFSMSLKVKSGDGRGSSAAGSSSVVSGLSQQKEANAGAKRKGLEIFGASGKKIKL